MWHLLLLEFFQGWLGWNWIINYFITNSCLYFWLAVPIMAIAAIMGNISRVGVKSLILEHFFYLQVWAYDTRSQYIMGDVTCIV